MDRPAVDRTALVNRILGTGAPAIEIIAPAGFGKSYLAKRLSDPLGARVPADCREMETLPSAIRALLRALGPFEAPFEARLAQYLVALDPADTSEALWFDVLDEALLHERNGRACWIENAEMLAEFAAGAEAVDRVIRKGVRVLICSREAPALPSLSRIPPNDRCVVGIDDLRFGDAEAAKLFASGSDRRLVRQALDAARGWPIAVLTYVRAVREGRRAYRSREMDDYVLNEALSGLSPKAKLVIAGMAQLRTCTEADVELLCDGAQEVLTELQASPFVGWSDGRVEVHALASMGLASKQREALSLLREAAKHTDEPLRAAKFYMAAGDPESAASLLDGVLAPFFLGESQAEFVDVVSSLGKAVLTRHPATWCATITLRAYAMSQHELLAESRAAWEALHADAPLLLRIGVGLTLINSLLFFNLSGEADGIFGALQRRIDDAALAGTENALVGYRAFADLRRGRRIDVDGVMEAVAPLLRDVPESQASALTSLVGPEAFMRGDRDASRRAFSRSLEIGRGIASPVYLAIGLCNAAFFAWLAGETALFDSCVEELVATSRPTVSGGTHHFIACATSANPAAAVAGFELHYLRAFGYIVAAGREPSGGAKATAARLALDAAEVDGQPWLRAFCHAVLACLDGDPSGADAERARELAAMLEYRPLGDDIATLADGRIPDRWPGLNSLAGASLDPLLQVFFATNEVTLDGATIALSRREMELVLAMALHEGARDRQTLAAMLWPDTPEGDGAAAATVYVARLRRRLKRPNLIEATRSGYRLRCRVALDLERLERMAAMASADPTDAAASPTSADAVIERLIRSKHSRLAQWMLTSECLAPYARRYAAALEVIRRERERRAGALGDAASAALYHQLLAAESAEEVVD